MTQKKDRPPLRYCTSYLGGIVKRSCIACGGRGWTPATNSRNHRLKRHCFVCDGMGYEVYPSKKTAKEATA